MRECDEADADKALNRSDYAVGFCRSPLHTRFKPGISGNPSGRAKGSQNFKTLLDRILKEEIPLLDGDRSRKVTKAEAITRRLVIGALKGDSRSMLALFKLAEQTGEFEEAPVQYSVIERIIVDSPARSANE